jgi:hypothetical protein
MLCDEKKQTSHEAGDFGSGQFFFGASAIISELLLCELGRSKS